MKTLIDRIIRIEKIIHELTFRTLVEFLLWRNQKLIATTGDAWKPNPNEALLLTLHSPCLISRDVFIISYPAGNFPRKSLWNFCGKVLIWNFSSPQLWHQLKLVFHRLEKQFSWKVNFSRQRHLLLKFLMTKFFAYSVRCQGNSKLSPYTLILRKNEGKREKQEICLCISK